MKNTVIKAIVALSLLLSFSNLSADEDKMLKPVPFSEIKPLIANGKTMMIEFGAESCRSCVVMGKLLYKVKQEHPTSNLFFVNIYNDKEAAKEYKIIMMPTQVYLDGNGKEVDRHIGKMTEDALYVKLIEMKIISDTK